MSKDPNYTGHDEFVKNLKRLQGNVPYLIINYGLLAAAREAEKLAKKTGAYFRDRTGALRKSIKAKQERKPYGWNNIAKTHSGVYRFVSYRIGGKGAMHANQVELGNRHMQARAPIRKSADDAESRMFDAALRGSRRRFDKMVRDLNAGRRNKEITAAAEGQ